jgi:hypothetical protein
LTTKIFHNKNTITKILIKKYKIKISIIIIAKTITQTIITILNKNIKEKEEISLKIFHKINFSHKIIIVIIEITP